MNFFQQLFDQLDGINLTLNIKRKNGKLTLSVLPQTMSTINPAIITGTPDELESGFFEAIKVPLDQAKGLNVELANLEASIKTVKEKKEKDLKEAETIKSKSTNKKTEKPINKKGTKKVENVKIVTPDLFQGV